MGDGELANPYDSLSGLLNLTCIGANSSTRHVDDKRDASWQIVLRSLKSFVLHFVLTRFVAGIEFEFEVKLNNNNSP